jgi:hypothetical protein
MFDFEQLVKDGVIDQDLCNKILEYMKQNAPQKQADETEPAEGSEPPALPDGSKPEEGSEPPALPDGSAPAEGSEPPAGPEDAQGSQGAMEEQLLKNLLDGGVITQEQYDLLLSQITTADSTESET